MVTGEGRGGAGTHGLVPGGVCFHMRLLLLTAALTLLLPNRAHACGGMFCDSTSTTTVVEQAAERIIFSFDGSTLDTEVQISFEGEADEFAWVVPVPVEPELYVSNDAMFTALAEATGPRYVVTTAFTGAQPLSVGCGCFDVSTDTATAGGGGFGENGENGGSMGVVVVSEETVGPYETVVLQATNAGVLVGWLQDQGYTLPDTLDAALEPYVATGQYFVALKLASDKDAGDLTPIGMRYPATAASIPIQLTSIAAIPDLPIEVFVLGPSRAVPDNYLHVQLNEAAFDWFGGLDNYRGVVARAVDEAGGQAFVTEFVGPPGALSPQVDAGSSLDLTRLAAVVNPAPWVERIVDSSLTPSAQLRALIFRFVPLPAGVEADEFLACPTCYTSKIEAPDFDAVVATAALEVEVLAPMRDQLARLDDAAVVTRLFTTMDPEEMTADPLFVFNAELPQSVSNTYAATDTTDTTDDVQVRTLELSDGRVYQMADPENPSMDAFDSPAALVIEDLASTGLGTTVFDGTADAKALADASACGCAGDGMAAAPLALLAVGAMLRRRR